MIMEEWKEYKLGDVANVKGGKRLPKGINLTTIANTHPYIRVRDLGTKKILELDSSYEYVDDETQKSISKYIVNSGDIILSIVGTIGLVAVIGTTLDGANLTENCVKLINVNKIDKEYLYYYLSSDIGKSEIEKGTVGAVQAKLPIKNIQSINIKAPAIELQKRIASILKSLDDKIEVNRRINENLEQQAQALFKSWFVDFEPFKDQPFVESELGMIPQGWSIDNIYKYVDVIYGAPYKSSLFNEKKEGLPLIRIRDLKTNSPQVYTSETLPTTEYIEAGDIVAGMDAEFVPCVWLGERGVLNQRCCKFKAKDPSISNYYILFLLKPELEYVQSYKTGTTVSHLGKSDIDRFRFITPPIDVIIPFSRRVDALLKEKVAIAQESRCLAELRDTLLPRLMSGELKVNDVI